MAEYLVLLLNKPTSKHQEGILLGFVAQAASPGEAFENTCARIKGKVPLTTFIKEVHDEWPYWEIRLLKDSDKKYINWRVQVKPGAYKLSEAIQKRIDRGDWTSLDGEKHPPEPRVTSLGPMLQFTNTDTVEVEKKHDKPKEVKRPPDEVMEFEVR